MGNIKHKTNYRNNHRHVYRKKKLPQKYKSKESKHSKSPPSGISPVAGSRIINLRKLEEYSTELNAHSTQCNGNVVLLGERRQGLASILKMNCSACNHTITLETSTKVKGSHSYPQWECNLAAVWGEMTTGGGHSRLKESLSVLGVPVMTKASFISTERGIGERWREELAGAMAEAGREERRLAIERGDFNEGVPAITVIVDGGWSKRTHKHSYNAKSGVAIIIGKETGQILYIGVRNKYCAGCAQGISREKHKCFKNWSASSSEMESDIILEGFLEAERVHGVRYSRFIGDGDSSVHTTLIQGVPMWGYSIKKVECANHACKCYRSSLEKLVQQNSEYKGSGGLTEKMRKRLVSAARCAIRMRSKESDQRRAVKLLERDLINGPNHCFGYHDACSTDFCSTARQREQLTSVPVTATSAGHSDVEGDMSSDDSNSDVSDLLGMCLVDLHEKYQSMSECTMCVC